MTVSTVSARVTYSGDAATTVFSVPYYFVADADLAVYLTVSGVTTEQTLSTHYTVSGSGDETGGSITMLAAPASGATLTIIREPEQVQATDYQANDPFPAETHERALDKQMMVSQHLQDQISRAILLPVNSTDVSGVLPAPEADKSILWNSTATELVNGPTASEISSAQSYAESASGSADKAEEAVSMIGSEFTGINDFTGAADGATDDTDAWNDFQAGDGFPMIAPGEYLVNGEIKRFDGWVLGNGEFDDDEAAWDQPQGDRERDSLIVHGRTIDANNTRVSPAIKTQTLIDWERDTSAGSFKHVVGAYHEARYRGYYDIQTDTNQNFTVAGSAVVNEMAGKFGGLAHLAYCEDVDETVNANIATMGASKNGCSFMRATRRAKFEHGGYMFGLEVFMINSADEEDDIPYVRNDQNSYNSWTTGLKLSVGGNGAPITSCMFTNGLGGKHGAYTGILIGGSTFRINDETQGAEGTVGLCLATHRPAGAFADVGIKFRTNNRHTYFREGHKSRASKTRLMYEEGACGLSIESGSGSHSYIHLSRGVTSAADGGSPLVSGQIDANGTWTRLQSNEGEAHLSSNGGDEIVALTSERFAPAVANDGVLHLGGATRRWDTVYATTATISTSDERAKEQIFDIPDAVLDAWGDVNFKQYKLIDAVAKKGSAARLHTGVIAQQVIAAFAAHGLDARDYGLLCYDEWDAQEEVTETSRTLIKEAEYEQVLVKDAIHDESGNIVEAAVYEDGEETTPAVYEEHTHIVQPAVAAGNRYSIRYEEALCIEAAYQRRRMALIEARLDTLEA